MEGKFFSLWPPFLILLILSTIGSLRTTYSQQSPAYMGFLSNATEFPAEDYYDYIVVGGGTAGCPLAATLSEKFRVLVLERGGVPFGDPNLMNRDGFLTALTEVDAYESPAQAFTSEDGVPNARGRVLGGSSAINAGFYSRADPDFYARSGINWDLPTVNQSYKWVENAVVFRPDLNNWQSAVRDALLEAGIYPYNGFTLDHIVGTKIGGSTFDNSGHRHTAADLLRYSNPSNIKIVIHATVERILLASKNSNPRTQSEAIGVVFRDRTGQYHHAMVRDGGEILLCAGALGTPQLLLLSGIGPRPYLASWGIPVAHHSPYVGQFLYDNPRNGISIVPPVPLDHSLIQVVGITSSGTYLEAASNIVPFTSPARPAFIRSRSPGGSSTYITVATLMEKIVGPASHGSLRLASTDARANPRVRFNYFSNPSDLDLCVNGTRRIGHVLRSRAMEDFRFHQWFGGREFRYVGPPLPRDLSSDARLREFCRRTVTTIWHYHGGCLVGRVVDGDLKVIGIDSLRVIDGSAFTVSPGTNPQATLLMMGRYFGLKLLRERAR
ncbi:hypothetical protein ACP275_04G090500 [Erythranthe tilingii]